MDKRSWEWRKNAPPRVDSALPRSSRAFRVSRIGYRGMINTYSGKKEGRKKGREERRGVKIDGIEGRKEEKRRAIDEEALGSCRQIKITLKLSEHGVCLGCGFKVIKGT